ncbi:hypothetical protein LEN26_014333 [Aphanomyces euteiches]|nr:hypothetical protein LEN26_014333 [Aphanomyces euteiches]
MKEATRKISMRWRRHPEEQSTLSHFRIYQDLAMQAQRHIMQEDPKRCKHNVTSCKKTQNPKPESERTELDATKAALKQCREQLQSAREEIDEKVEFVNVLSSYIKEVVVRRQNVDKLDLFLDLFTRALKLLAALLERSLRSIELSCVSFHRTFLLDETLCLHR